MGLAKLLDFIRLDKNNTKYSDCTIDTGGGNNLTAEHFADSGDDSHPLKNDYAVYVNIPRTGGKAVVGYIDPKNNQKAEAGDKRIYARNTDGEQVIEFWLKNNAEAVLENDKFTLTIKENGETSLKNEKADIVISESGDISFKNEKADITAKNDGNITLNNADADIKVNADTSIELANNSGFLKIKPDGEVNINGAKITPDGEIITKAGINVDKHTHSQPNDSYGNIEQDVLPPTNKV
ncbi:hypothetical protein [Francisella philomiragia]|uniref:Gp5/Type VI secretion system Vgr protein OB-fold domain-containing protein n=1 Tax=Francisella philomiragia TaxID=28110 RepID=A0ABS1GCD8_9GAMM|nr:hypothetical protein [Francisella philomiragia]MBK2258740.1 hypothetical protein [Francisella philomiragia]MBK2302431.1 hypothetical protein [Francisella philomiragia]